MASKTTRKTAPRAAATAEKGRVLKRKPRAAKAKPAAADAAATDSTMAATKPSEPIVGSLAALRETFCAALLTRGKSAGTARSYAADLKVAERHFGDRKAVAELTRAEVEGFMTSDLVTLGRSGARKNQITIDKVLRVFRQALEHAVEIGWIPESPMPPYERKGAKKTTAAAEEASDAQG